MMFIYKCSIFKKSNRICYKFGASVVLNDFAFGRDFNCIFILIIKYHVTRETSILMPSNFLDKSIDWVRKSCEIFVVSNPYDCVFK